MILLALACASGDSAKDSTPGDTQDSAAPARTCLSVLGVEHDGAYVTCLGSFSGVTTVVAGQGLAGCDTCTLSVMWQSTTPADTQTCDQGQLYVVVKDEAFADFADEGTAGYAGSALGGDSLGSCSLTTTAYTIGDDGATVTWAGSGTASVVLVDTFGVEVGTRELSFTGDVEDGA